MTCTNAARRLLAAGLLGLLALAPLEARAWKPFTHNYTGSEILNQIDFPNSRVLIAGQWYSIPVEARDAILACPSCYYAGTVGPDGFPDLTYGQAVIHPGGKELSQGTGAWLEYLLDRAWAAYWANDWDRDRILAFTYGFLTHCAGDVWGHTIVNEMSHGVFPEVGQILTNVEKAAEAIRHIISEGYIGEATPGFDGNPDFEVHDGVYTDVSTTSYPYDVPREFLYRALVDPRAPTPIRASRGAYLDARGPIIGTFLEMRDSLSEFVPDPLPDPIQEALGAYHDTLDALEDVRGSCDFRNFSDIWNCPADLLDLGFDVGIDSAHAFEELIVTAAEDLAYMVLGSYVDAWVKDIDGGLLHWSDLGLATTKGLFDSQARRRYQNDFCAPDPIRFPGDPNREECRRTVKTLDVVVNESGPFIHEHLLPMVGVPEIAIDVAEVLGEIADLADDVLAVLGLPFRPLEEAKELVVDYIKSVIENAIWEILGVDFEALAGILKSPTRYICASEELFDLPRLGPTRIPLFPDQEHARLDDYLLFTWPHHEEVPGVGPECGRLLDGVKYSPDTFSPITDTAVMGKLLLLQGGELNRLLGSLLNRTIRTYADLDRTNHVAGDNIMTKPILGTAPWLALIDGDHAWRPDGKPVFLDRNEERTGGNGTFPLWASCVLRPAFRQLFTDWENPWSGRAPPYAQRDNFPDLDRPLSDPINDPDPPTSKLETGGNVYVDPATGSVFLGANAWLVLSAQDGPRSASEVLAFADSDLKLRFRVTPSATGAWVNVKGSVVDAILLGQGDGAYTVEYQAADPCHTFEEPVEVFSVGNPEPLRTFQAFRDSAPPVTTCHAPPFGLTYATDAFATVDFSIDDGPLGSAVKSFSATIDGDVFAAGPVPIAKGDTIDMFRYGPGVRTVSVTSADNLGNAGTKACTFELHATTASLIANLNRARAEGSVPSSDVFKGLMDKLLAAHKADLAGRTTPEIEQLEAFVYQLLAQRGKGIAQVRADQLAAYARDRVARLTRVSSL